MTELGRKKRLKESLDCNERVRPRAGREGS